MSGDRNDAYAHSEASQVLPLHSQVQKAWLRSMVLKVKQRPESPEGLLSRQRGHTPEFMLQEFWDGGPTEVWKCG